MILFTEWKYVHAQCVLSHFSCVRLCVTPWTIKPPDSSGHGDSSGRILEWITISSSKRSSQPRDWTRVSCVSCIGRWVLSHEHHLRSLSEGRFYEQTAKWIWSFPYSLPAAHSKSWQKSLPILVSNLGWLSSAIFMWANSSAHSLLSLLVLALPPLFHWYTLSKTISQSDDH